MTEDEARERKFKKAWREYEKARERAWAAFDAIEHPAWNAYEEIVRYHNTEVRQ